MEIKFFEDYWVIFVKVSSPPQHMFKSIFTKQEQESVHDLILFFLLCLMVIAMPTSRYFVSVAQILMGFNWLVEGHWWEKIRRFARNKAAVIFILIYGVYLLGMLWTEDVQYGIGYDLKNKLPLFTLTFVLASSRPLSKERWNMAALAFSLTVLVTSVIGFILYLNRSFINPRSISPFESHVYFSMMVVLVIFLLPWQVKRMSTERTWLTGALLISVWLLFYLFLLSSLTGLLCLAGVVAFLVFREFIQGKVIFRRILAGLGLAGALIIVILLMLWVIKPLTLNINPDQQALTARTASGNGYRHDTGNHQRENGHLVYHFIAEEEIGAAWGERSRIPIDSLDHTGHPLKATLYRFLSSKGLKKDKESILSLREEEVRAIEHGVPNHLYMHWPHFMTRLHQSGWEVMEYQRTGNPSGHTFSQRLELWKASVVALKKHLLLGWGTGDIFLAMDYGLSALDSPLDNYRMKPHNQYLILLLMVGLIGTLAVFLLYFLFIREARATRYLPFNIFLVIMGVSMLGNNPLDAQVGLSFFVFFSLFFGLFSKDKNEVNA